MPATPSIAPIAPITLQDVAPASVPAALGMEVGAGPADPACGGEPGAAGATKATIPEMSCKAAITAQHAATPVASPPLLRAFGILGF